MKISKIDENITLDYLINHPEDSNFDRKNVQRKLKKLQDLELITLIGTYVKELKKVYVIK